MYPTERILTYLEEQRPAMVSLLVELAQAESPSNVPETHDDVRHLLASALDNAGMQVRQFPGRRFAGMLYARPHPRRRTSLSGGADGPPRPHHPRRACQLLVGHWDTVWPLGTLNTMPVHVEGDLLKGPGVYDMKGGLVQILFAVRALHDLELRPPAIPLVLMNSDEEVGSPESTPLIRRLAKCAARAYVLEGALGTKGKLKTARKTVGRFRVIVEGRAAHAGVEPQAGVSAILEMSHQVQKLFTLNDPARGITVNVGTIDGGMRPNVVAPRVEAVLDVRVPTQRNAEEVEAAIRNLKPTLSGATIQVEGDFGRPPMEANERNLSLWRWAEKLGREELGIELEHTAVGGASDANTTSLYTATLDGLGPVGEGAHAVHEHIRISKLMERTALLCLLLMAPLKPPREQTPQPLRHYY